MKLMKMAMSILFVVLCLWRMDRAHAYTLHRRNARTDVPESTTRSMEAIRDRLERMKQELLLRRLLNSSDCSFARGQDCGARESIDVANTIEYVNNPNFPGR